MPEPDIQQRAGGISSAEFAQFQKLLFTLSGIHLAEAKKPLLVGRLNKRLRHFGFARFADYFRYVSQDAHQEERQIMVDLLTTNETYFFREPRHFDFLRQYASQRRGAGFRAWSAAASSGEEAYSMAMVLADTLGDSSWEVIGTDISHRALAKAQSGHYRIDRIDGIPPHLLKRYCLKGQEDQAGTLLIAREVRERVRFLYSNLMAPVGNLGLFDVILLRNVMIYFTHETKCKAIANLLPYLKRDGYFIVGHSESLNGINMGLTAVQPTIYRRAS